MGFSFSEAILKKNGKGDEGSLRRQRGGGSQNQPDHLAQMQTKESERTAEDLFDKDDFSTKCVTENEKDILPQMRGLSLMKRSMQEYVSTGTIEEDFSLDEQVEKSGEPGKCHI